MVSVYPFNTFLKDLDPETHKEYVFEKFKDGKSGKNFQTENPEDIFKKLDTSKPTFKKKIVIDLPDTFSVDLSQKISHEWSIFTGTYFCAENFQEFVNSIKPGSFDNPKYGEQRIVIPLVRNNKLIGVREEPLSSNPIKYLTIMLDDGAPKFSDLTQSIKNYQSMWSKDPSTAPFINNSVKTQPCGSDGEVSDLEGSDKVFVYDNEPRNKEIVAEN